MQDAPPLEVAVQSDPVEVHEQPSVFLAERLPYLLRPPNEEFPLFALAVCVLRAIEPAFRRCHLARGIVQRFLHDLPMRLIPSDLVGMKIQSRQQRVVVQHLLEVGH